MCALLCALQQRRNRLEAKATPDIASAAAALTARRVSSLLVTKADIYDDSDVSDGGTPGSNRVVGMITARDILRGLTAMGTAAVS